MVSFSYISVSATLHIFDTVFVCVVDVAVTEEAWDADKRRCPILFESFSISICLLISYSAAFCLSCVVPLPFIGKKADPY